MSGANGLRRAGRTEEGSGPNKHWGFARKRRPAARGTRSWQLGNLRRDCGWSMRGLSLRLRSQWREIRSRRFEGNLSAISASFTPCKGGWKKRGRISSRPSSSTARWATVVSRASIGQSRQRVPTAGKVEQAKTHFEQALTIHRESATAEKRDRRWELGPLQRPGLLTRHANSAKTLAIHRRKWGDRPFEGASARRPGQCAHGQGRMEKRWFTTIKPSPSIGQWVTAAPRAPISAAWVNS
jgi:hypothetical protein